MNRSLRKLLGLLQHSQQTQQTSPPHQLSTSRTPEQWHIYWKVQGQSWRTEPEINTKRQQELAQCRTTVPDIEKGIYPFKGMKLSRADVEWLLVTHENGRGPVDWSDKAQHGRKGIDLRGVNLNDVNLSGLPLAAMLGGVTSQERLSATTLQCYIAGAHMERADFSQAHLEGATLRNAHLEDAIFESTHLEKVDLAGAYLGGAHFGNAHLDGAYLRRAYLDSRTFLNNISLGNEKAGFVSMVDIDWSGVNLATVQWQQVKILGEEERAKQKRTNDGKMKDKRIRLHEHEVAVRAYRQLAVVLQAQGLNEDAARFAYRAQKLQRVVLRRQKRFVQYLFSLFLGLTTGYGYRVWRSFATYVLVIAGFATAYYLLGPRVGLPLSWVDAIVFSMTSFHGRGFSPGENISLSNPLTILAAIEAFVGLIIEVTFIATLTQRFFGK